MIRILIVALALLPFATAASASPLCLKVEDQFALASDKVHWEMSTPKTGECLQGLRMSYMQIFEVSVLTKPKFGNLVILGSGFRYVANKEQAGADSFTLLVVGKNRRDYGRSTINVSIAGGARAIETSMMSDQPDDGNADVVSSASSTTLAAVAAIGQSQ